MNDKLRFVTNQRGVALPMSMLALIILSALVIAFSVLSSTEPSIANNQLSVAQARSVAEAGVERAIWALNRGLTTPGDPQAIASPLTGTAAASMMADGTITYAAGQLVPVSTGGYTIGGFKVAVASKNTTPLPAGCPTSMINAELCIVAVGWVPNDTTTNPKAHQKVVVTVMNPKFLLHDPPAALSVRGELQAGGNSLIDSRADTSCGAKDGTLTTGATSIIGNAADIWGADGNNVRNQFYDAGNGDLPSTPSDIVDNLSTQAFDRYIWTDADINALRTYAKAHGTYLQGSVTFDAGNKIPNGVVFVDTTDGTNITAEGVTPPTPTSRFATVDIHGNPPADPSGIFSGILFVNGTLSIDGNFVMHGLAYAQNDISYHGVGTGGVWGAMMSRNIRDQVSTSIDSDLNGNALINYNCAYATTGGLKRQDLQWTVEPGTYRELSGS